jgi:hypothetical protein
MALAHGLSGSSTTSASEDSQPPSIDTPYPDLPSPPKTAVSTPAKSKQDESAGRGGGLNLRVGMTALRLKIYNDCPGFRSRQPVQSRVLRSFS